MPDLRDEDLRLPSDNIFKTGIYEAKLIAQLSYGEERPYFVFSGRGCAECDINPSIYIHSPSDGLLNGEMAPRYPFPGQVFYHEDQSLIFESKMFFGKFSELISTKPTTDKIEKTSEDKIPRENKSLKKLLIIVSAALIIGIIVYNLN